MSARRCGVALVLAVAIALLLPTGAPAETFSFGPGSVIFATVRATDGYRVNFSENDKGYLFVRVKGHDTTTDFATHTKADPEGRLIGDLGRRGGFDLRFVPVGRPEVVPSGPYCHGKAGRWQEGRLIGRAHLRTERGFTQVTIHRLPAAQESWSRLTCDLDKVPLPGHPKEQRITFSANVSKPGRSFLDPPRRTLRFRATEFFRQAKPAGSRVLYAAELKEHSGRVSIHRTALVRTSERSLSLPGAPDLPEELELEPPAPFSGSAAFLRTHESAYTWTGDLSVAFPGIDPVRLTGPRFATVICALKGCIARRAETGTSIPAPRPFALPEAARARPTHAQTLAQLSR